MTGVTITREVAEIGRLLWANQLDARLAANALGIDVAQAEQLKQGAAVPLDPARRDHSALLLNILIRVEVRAGHDPAALRAALERPAEALAGDSIAARLLGATDLAGLRLLRDAAGTLPMPKVRMWRTADRYS